MVTIRSNNMRRSLATAAPVIVMAALTIIFMLLPWLHLSLPASYANTPHAVLGQYANLAADYNMVALAATVNGLPIEAFNLTNVKTIMWGFAITWGIAILLIAFGSALYLRGNNKLLIAGCIIAMLTILAFCGFVLHFQQTTSKVIGNLQALGISLWPYAAPVMFKATIPLWPYVAAIAAIATIVLAIALNPARRTAGVRRGGYSPAPINTPAPRNPRRRSSTPAVMRTASTPYVCPACGATNVVESPQMPCLIIITCENCGARFPMEIRSGI